MKLFKLPQTAASISASLSFDKVKCKIATGMPLLSLSVGISGLKACSRTMSGTFWSLSVTVPKG